MDDAVPVARQPVVSYSPNELGRAFVLPKTKYQLRVLQLWVAPNEEGLLQQRLAYGNATSCTRNEVRKFES